MTTFHGRFSRFGRNTTVAHHHTSHGGAIYLLMLLFVKPPTPYHRLVCIVKTCAIQVVGASVMLYEGRAGFTPNRRYGSTVVFSMLEIEIENLILFTPTLYEYVVLA